MAMIIVYGSINIDLVARVGTIPGPGMTVLAPSYTRHFGGKGANQAVAAARVAGRGRVVMAARVGDDAFGAEARANLADNGVGTDLVLSSAEPTGCAFITVDAKAENAITVASGANATLAADDVPQAMLGPRSVLVLQMEVPFAHALALAQRTRTSGGRVIWNMAPVPDDLGAEAIAALIDATDLLVVNEHEAMAAASRLGLAAGRFEDAAGAIARRGTTCIVTAGAAGAIAFSAAGQRLAATAPRIDPIDTTGAGDTFVGILAAMVAEGRPLPEALAFGCRGAALACLSLGAQSGMPTRAALEEFGGT
jgi:ribokinase